MIMGEIPSARYAVICNMQGDILWNSKKDKQTNLLTLEETKDSIRRAIASWRERDKLSAKIGRGKYVIAAYEKIKRITIPLPNDHLLFVSLEGEEFGNIRNLMFIVDWVDKNMGL